MQLQSYATAGSLPPGAVVATYLVKRKPGMSYADYAAHQLGTHVPLALSLPGLLDYRLTMLPPGPDGDQAFDGIAQVTFASAEAQAAAMASPEGQAALADLPNYLDPGAMVILSAPTTEIHVGVV